MSVLLLSGGLDSLVLLARECHAGQPPLCISFDYGQRHLKELQAARDIIHFYGVSWLPAELPFIPFADSALTRGGAVPHAHYADPAQATTVVPNRNLTMLSVAAALAVSHGEKVVLFAAHSGDAAIYQDCRPEFVEAADKAIRLACGVGVEAPFLGMTKGDIVALARVLKVPTDMAWSCYEGGSDPCGKCGACVERTEAEAL